MEDADTFFVHRALVPVRGDARDSAEMVTQLLFGDLVHLLEHERQWMRIRNASDGYEGWIDEKMVLPLAKEEWRTPDHWEYVLAPALALHWETPQGDLPLHLSLGCRFPVFKEADPAQDHRLQIGDHVLTVPREALHHCKQTGPTALLDYSARYLGAPYLWGGKSLWGIDCSGFTQICHAVCGKSIPRDASQQVHIGTELSFDERKPGDLAFFKNEKGKVHHVGIVLENERIRHASGSVHDALLTANGIVEIKQQKLTHQLCSIKRIS